MAKHRPIFDVLCNEWFAAQKSDGDKNYIDKLKLKIKIQNKIYTFEKNKYELVKSLQIKGVTNISVPIFDHTNNAIAALTIPFVDRIIKKNELDIKQVTKLLKMFDKKLSSEMSYGSI